MRWCFLADSNGTVYCWKSPPFSNYICNRNCHTQALVDCLANMLLCLCCDMYKVLQRHYLHNINLIKLFLSRYRSIMLSSRPETIFHLLPSYLENTIERITITFFWCAQQKPFTILCFWQIDKICLQPIETQ